MYSRNSQKHDILKAEMSPVLERVSPTEDLCCDLCKKKIDSYRVVIDGDKLGKYVAYGTLMFGGIIKSDGVYCPINLHVEKICGTCGKKIDNLLLSLRGEKQWLD